jgi:hypothetical protein
LVSKRLFAAALTQAALDSGIPPTRGLQSASFGKVAETTRHVGPPSQHQLRAIAHEAVIVSPFELFAAVQSAGGPTAVRFRVL